MFGFQYGEGGAGVRIVVVVTKKIKQYIDKGYFNEFFLISLNNFSKENLKTILKNDEITLLSQSVTTTGYDLF